MRRKGVLGRSSRQVTRTLISADFIRTIKGIDNGSAVIRLESDIPISEDPSVTFGFVPNALLGAVKADIDYRSNRDFEGRGPEPSGRRLPLCRISGNKSGLLRPAPREAALALP